MSRVPTDDDTATGSLAGGALPPQATEQERIASATGRENGSVNERADMRRTIAAIESALYSAASTETGGRLRAQATVRPDSSFEE